MGSINNALRSISGANEEEQRAKERLEILLLASKAKIQAFRDEINENFMNPAQIDKKQIPGIRALKYIEQYHVATQSNFNDQVKGHLDKAVDAFFSLGEGNNKGAVKTGLKELISGALDAFIGSTSAGESEQKTYVVIPENNAFVRVDIACWKYNFSQTKIINQHDSAVAYVLCKSVIDHTKLTIDELIYLTTEVLSSSEIVNQEMNSNNYLAELSLENAPSKTEDLKKQLKIIGYSVESINSLFSTKGLEVKVDGKAVDYETIRSKGLENKFLRLKDANTWEWSSSFEGFGSYQRRKPASIGNVEAYIEELIRVWKKLKAERKED